MIADLVQAWRTLENADADRRGDLRVTKSGVETAWGNALVALDAMGLPHLLLPVREDVRVEVDERSGGVQIVGRILVNSDGAASSYFVDVACRKPHLLELFASLSREILEEVVIDPRRPASVAHRVLNRWRELLDKERGSVLSDEKLVGLFGELHLLRQLSVFSPNVCKVWTGPSGARFDFQREKVALEVKTTTSVQRRVVHVHGLGQLDVPENVELFLLVLSIEPQIDSGLSIPAILSELSDAGVDSLELNSKLNLVGYSTHDRPYYLAKRFAVRSEKYFRVDDEMPRLIPDSFKLGALPKGVADVRYTIDLSAPPPDSIDEAASGRLLKELAS